MSSQWLQLWVERRGLDPAAWTASHALQLLLGGEAPAHLGRADLWELEAEDAGEGLAARFETWTRASNLFLNPGRDRGFVLAGAPPDPVPVTAYVVVCDRGGGEARAHALTLSHALGGRWRARRGTVLTIVWSPERADDVPELADRVAYARRRRSGLLVNDEAQEARILVGEWCCPVLPPWDAVPRAAAGGNDRG